jgi:hypothetical protein
MKEFIVWKRLIILLMYEVCESLIDPSMAYDSMYGFKMDGTLRTPKFFGELA